MIQDLFDPEIYLSSFEAKDPSSNNTVSIVDAIFLISSEILKSICIRYISMYILSNTILHFLKLLPPDCVLFLNLYLQHS